ncbi:LuxR C-terminal-related transcriptional regulator [Kribbella sp. NBC_01245]|uniref:LuxR C-terminal-related transcriptional regulator n=1 Tax=Kribbella sp. NBC_01245 TaxID=2903578 RepID=UPI002E29A0A7|nr:LuxR C-terminal-related transcriptional regulator [Kribbella sp. NBC_01245]
MTPDALVREADVRARAGDYAGALALREQAYAALRAGGDTSGAARLAAYQIAFDHLALFGNTAVSKGWLERGIRLAEESGDCVEAGWVALARALHAADSGERDHWIATAARSADTFDDDDLHFVALAYRGLTLVEAGRVTDGMRRLDEAAAAAYSGEVGSSVVAGEIYCKLMVACEVVLDVPRAEQWHRVFAALEQQLDVAWASAICRMHVGTVWTAAGRWDEAERELTRSLALYDATYRALRPAACARLAELRVRQGQFVEAERLLVGSGDDSFGIRAATRVAWQQAITETERKAAVAALVEVLAQHDGELAMLPDLALLAELQLACGQAEAAAGSATRLAEMSLGDIGAALTGYARLAEGLVAAGHPHAQEALRTAVRHFAAARLPLEQARARVALAQAVAASDPGVALVEARQAAETFGWLGAAAEFDRTSALLRSLGARPSPMPRADGLLTGREHDVLVLVADGLSNPEIAERLFLSKKTVAHHVSNVLAKLGVRNRAEASAWLVAHDNDR